MEGLKQFHLGNKFLFIGKKNTVNPDFYHQTAPPPWQMTPLLHLSLPWRFTKQSALRAVAPSLFKSQLEHIEVM